MDLKRGAQLAVDEVSRNSVMITGMTACFQFMYPKNAYSEFLRTGGFHLA